MASSAREAAPFGNATHSWFPAAPWHRRPGPFWRRLPHLREIRVALQIRATIRIPQGGYWKYDREDLGIADTVLALPTADPLRQIWIADQSGFLALGACEHLPGSEQPVWMNPEVLPKGMGSGDGDSFIPLFRFDYWAHTQNSRAIKALARQRQGAELRDDEVRLHLSQSREISRCCQSLHSPALSTQWVGRICWHRYFSDVLVRLLESECNATGSSL